MTDLLSHLAGLRRPRLLIRAAQHGAAAYDRNRDLRRVLRLLSAPDATRALPSLIEAEADLDASRRSGDAGYSVARHVELLIALMAEARLALCPAE